MCMEYSRICRLNPTAGVVSIVSRVSKLKSWHFIPTTIDDNDFWIQHLRNNLNCLFADVMKFDAMIHCESARTHLPEGNYDSTAACAKVKVVKHSDMKKDLGYILKLDDEERHCVTKGSIIFMEKAIVALTEQEIHRFLSTYQPCAFQVLSQVSSSDIRNQMAHFLLPGHCFALVAKFNHISCLQQQEVLNLCCPMDDLNEVILKALQMLSTQLSASFSPLSPATILQLLVISSSNVFGDENLTWIGWFQLGCRVNHSCLPNASWTLMSAISPSSSPVLAFTALCDIRPGTEITHSYLERERWYGRKQRRDTLFMARGFTCRCVECAPQHERTSEGDACDTGDITYATVLSEDRKRRFVCSACGLGSSVVVVEGILHGGVSRETMRCETCCVQLSNSLCKEHIRREVVF